MIVRPAKRIFSAISFGVFCLEAPSTSLIMRSRKVSPGFDVMRTLISSDRTRVPPVTAERSPPDSRITGADSPVIADSSTDATPSMTSPSPGIKSPAVTTTMSPERNFELGTHSVLPSLRNRRASVSARDFRKLSGMVKSVPTKLYCGENRADLHNKHHRVLDHRPRVQLAKGVQHCPRKNS